MACGAHQHLVIGDFGRGARDLADRCPEQSRELLSGAGDPDSQLAQARRAARRAERGPRRAAHGARQHPGRAGLGPPLFAECRAAVLTSDELATGRAGRETDAARTIEHEDHPSRGLGESRGAHHLRERGRVQPAAGVVAPSVDHLEGRPAWLRS